MSTLSDKQIELIKKIGYTSVADTSLTLTESETLETLKKSRLVRIRKGTSIFNSNADVTYYELGKKGFALFESMTAEEAIEAPAEEETLAAELPAIEPVRLTGVVTLKDGVQTKVTRDDNGEAVRVNRREAYRARLGKRIEFEIGRDNEGYEGVAIDVTDAPPVAAEFVPTVGELAMYVDQRVKVSARYADGYYRIVYFDESKNQHIVTRVKGSSLTPLYEEVPAILPEVAPAPTMTSALIAAKDEHIARLEACVQELEAKINSLKGEWGDTSGLKGKQWSIWLGLFHDKVGEILEEGNSGLPFEEERQTYHNDLGLGR